MSVNPGFSGQKFIESTLPKIAKAREIIEKSKHNIELEVDGGISPITSGSVIQAGANVLVAGSAVYGTKDYASAITAIRQG
jgi:ribulose-phosphate 3-epimerase